MNEYKNIKIKNPTPVGDWKNIREEFPTDEESQYLVRLDKDGMRRYFVCQLTDGWDDKKILKGCSFDRFDFIYNEPDPDQQAQAELIPDPEIPDCYWMRLE